MAQDEARDIRSPKFPLGQIVATPGALEACDRAGDYLLNYIERHAQGDWGELEDDDRKENELSLAKGFRLFSSYKLIDGTKIWIITEADRSVTTVLLPKEY